MWGLRHRHTSTHLLQHPRDRSPPWQRETHLCLPALASPAAAIAAPLAALAALAAARSQAASVRMRSHGPYARAILPRSAYIGFDLKYIPVSFLYGMCLICLSLCVYVCVCFWSGDSAGITRLPCRPCRPSETLQISELPYGRSQRSELCPRGLTHEHSSQDASNNGGIYLMSYGI